MTKRVNAKPRMPAGPAKEVEVRVNAGPYGNTLKYYRSLARDGRISTRDPFSAKVLGIVPLCWRCKEAPGTHEVRSLNGDREVVRRRCFACAGVLEDAGRLVWARQIEIGRQGT